LINSFGKETYQVADGQTEISVQKGKIELLPN